ncbi:MAG: mechanosensitive ion channel family protein [Candidatus Micrarchaeota archaeon]|nr:mechanosensitive ion channel family protein [Candidatus Micrarchaeota archaeon]
MKEAGGFAMADNFTYNATAIFDAKATLGENAWVVENPIAGAVLVVLGSIVLAFISTLAMRWLFWHVAKRTKTELDDKVLEALPEPTFRAIVLLGLLWAVGILGMGGAGSLASNIIVTLIYLVVVLAAVSIANVFFKYGFEKLAERTQSTLDDEIMPIAKKTTTAIIWIFGAILILSHWGVDIGPFLAGLGIAGLAVSFAMQDSLSNIFGGVSLILDKTFKVGDKVELDSGEIGVIADVGLRSTRIRTYNNEMITVPNSILAKTKIKNYVQPDHSLRLVVKFGVAYGTDTERARKVILSTIKGITGISKAQEPKVVFTSMGDSAVLGEAYFWVEDYSTGYDRWVEATEEIYKVPRMRGGGIPSPYSS